MVEVFTSACQSETNAFLMYKYFERNQDDSQDECLQLGCYDYM